MPGTAYHCELAWLGGDEPERDVLLTVADGRITGVEPGASAPPDAVLLAGLTLPGLANAHSHAFHRAMRGHTHSGPGTFWTWRQQMYRLAAVLDPDSYFALARATFAEMALAGVTCVGEFHYMHHQPGGTPYGDPNALGSAVTVAAREAGVRVTLLDTCYLQGGIGVELAPVQRRYSDGSAAAWADRVASIAESDLLKVAAAVHSVRAVDPGSIEQVAAWAGERKCPLHAHVSEQPAENDDTQAAFGCSPVSLLDVHHALSDRFTAVHATHLADGDVERLARTQSMVCMCPTTERDLADGIGPTREFRDAGVGMCLGSDSNAVIDLFEEARAVELDERLASGERGSHSVVSLLEAATAGGYRSLGWHDGGRIAVGALADLSTIGLRSVRTAGALAGNPLHAAVYAASAGDVTHVIVGGEPIVVDGRHRALDVAEELDRSIGALWKATQ